MLCVPISDYEGVTMFGSWKNRHSSLEAMSELLLNLRVANEKQRNEMLRKEDEKGAVPQRTDDACTSCACRRVVTNVLAGHQGGSYLSRCFALMTACSPTAQTAAQTAEIGDRIWWMSGDCRSVSGKDSTFPLGLPSFLRSP